MALTVIGFNKLLEGDEFNLQVWELLGKEHVRLQVDDIGFLQPITFEEPPGQVAFEAGEGETAFPYILTSDGGALGRIYRVSGGPNSVPGFVHVWF